MLLYLLLIKEEEEENPISRVVVLIIKLENRENIEVLEKQVYIESDEVNSRVIYTLIVFLICNDIRKWSCTSNSLPLDICGVRRRIPIKGSISLLKKEIQETSDAQSLSPQLVFFGFESHLGGFEQPDKNQIGLLHKFWYRPNFPVAGKVYMRSLTGKTHLKEKLSLPEYAPFYLLELYFTYYTPFLYIVIDTTKRLISSPKCRSVEVINNPARPGSNHKEVNCINYK